jgi:membrane fusion protein (multidrug efflux system)
VHLDQQEAELELQRADLAATQARERYRKTVIMERRGLASQDDVEAAQTQLAMADVAVQQARIRLQHKRIDDTRFRYQHAKTELQEAELHLQYTTITASVDGVISERQIIPGQHVNSDQNLFTIVDATRLRARTFLPEKFSRRITLSQPAYIEVEALPKQRFPARVQLISPVVDADSGMFKVTLALTQSERDLKPGMFATVFITVAKREHALVIPKRALVLDSPVPTVYRLQDGRAYRATLTLGYTDREWVEVTTGLMEDDRIVVVGHNKLLDGTAVQVVADEQLAQRPVRRE